MSKKDHHQIPLRLPTDLHESVESQARERGMTTSAYIREVLTNATPSNGAQAHLLKTLHGIDEHIESQRSFTHLLFDSQILITNSLFHYIEGSGSSRDKEETGRLMNSFLDQLFTHLSSGTWFLRVLKKAYQERDRSRERGRE